MVVQAWSHDVVGVGTLTTMGSTSARTALAKRAAAAKAAERDPQDFMLMIMLLDIGRGVGGRVVHELNLPSRCG